MGPKKKGSVSPSTTSASTKSGEEYVKTDDLCRLHNFGESSSSSDHMTPADILELLIDDRSPEETRDMYNWWADSYNEDMEQRKYRGPAILANYVSNTLRVPKAAQIMDMGCGTGLSGVALHDDFGYTDIDGVDISEEMMNIARKCGAYNNTFLEKVTPQSRLEFREVEYDCLVLCTSIVPGHISPQSLQNLSRIVKKKTGYIVWLGPTLESMGKKSTNFLELNFMKAISDCCEKSKMELIERKIIEDYREDCNGELFALRRK